MKDIPIVNTLHRRAFSYFYISFFNQIKTILIIRQILGWYILITLKSMYPTLLMHLSIAGYPNFVKFLAIMSSATVCNCIFVCIWT